MTPSITMSAHLVQLGNQLVRDIVVSITRRIGSSGDERMLGEAHITELRVLVGTKLREAAMVGMQELQRRAAPAPPPPPQRTTDSDPGFGEDDTTQPGVRRR